MTLILTVSGRETIWMLADRRLSYADRSYKDDARKLMTLETTDGVALLGYAGLGATSKGTEPADWMSAVLRGRNVPLEHALGNIADALKREFPPHLRQLSQHAVVGHNIIIPAFVNNEVRLYSIDISLNKNSETYSFRYTRHVADSTTGPFQRPPRIALAGSGATYLQSNKSWTRPLLRIVRGCDIKHLSPHAVADYLAEISFNSHKHTSDGTVGPDSIVIWRHRPQGKYGGGGGHQFFAGSARTSDSVSLPTIARGMDVQALVGAIMPFITPHMAALWEGDMTDELDPAEINFALSKLPSEPDEKLK